MNAPQGDDSAVRVRIAHLTTIDMSLALLLGTELEEDIAHGHEVIGISAAGPYVERVTGLGVKHVALRHLTRSWAPAQDARAFRELVTTLRGLDLDVLHTHNPKTGVMGRVAGRLAGVPVVVNTCHGLWARPEDSISKRAFVYGLEAVAARFSDFELFQNAEDRHTLRWALRRDRSEVVGNGVDLVRYRPDPAGRARVREELGIADGELLVGGVGRRVAEKGLVEFGAMSEALADTAKFVWVGPDDGEEPSELPGSVIFTGERADMPAVYSAFDIFVLPTYREGFSRAGMEAAACGLPMVLTDIRGCRQVGTHGEHLLLVPPADVSALIAAVRMLIHGADLRHRLSESASARAVEHFDQRAVAGTSLRVYERIAREKGLPWVAR